MTEHPNLRSKQDDSAGTAAFLEAILHMVIPLACQNVSRGMIDGEGMTLLLNEEPLKKGDKADVLKDIGFHVARINVVDTATLTKDMASMPTFEWPEKERAVELIMKESMTVLDLEQVTLKIMLGEGIEFGIPVKKMGMSATLEIGCGGDTIGNDAYFELHLPKVRLWVVLNEQKENFVSTKKQVYSKVSAAFIGRPNLTPHVHVNADRGKGDFWEMDFSESGSLDDVVEEILMGFGPKEHYEKEGKHEKKTSNKSEKQSWVGNAIGQQLSKALGKYVNLGHNR